MTANPTRPPKKHHFWILAYPAIPIDTSTPASAIVMSDTTKIPVCGAEPGGPAAWPGPSERRPQWLEELDGQDVAVDRRPQPEDEPPAGGGHDEAEAAAEDPALPDIVAARARDRHDEARIGDHQERNPDRRDED